MPAEMAFVSCTTVGILLRTGMFLFLLQTASGTLYAPEGAKPWWNADLLFDAAVIENPRQYKTLFDKLDRGKAINVVSWGSSIVASHAGCWSDDNRDRAVKVSGMPPATCMKDPVRGWIDHFMDWINQTWPHPNHLFVNAGIGGAYLSTYIRSGCFEKTVPDPVDIVILENLGGATRPDYLEQTVATLLRLAETRGQARPVIIIVNSYRIVASSMGSYQEEWEGCIINGNCRKDCTPRRAGFQHQIGGEDFGVMSKENTMALSYALGAYYGITVLSFGNLLLSAVRDGIVPKSGVAACEFFAMFMKDHIHPNDLGKQLYGDMLISSTQRARSYLQQHSTDTPVVVPQLPERGLFSGGRVVNVKRCYMKSIADPGITHLMEANDVPRDYLPIESSNGWLLVFYDKNQTQQHKPGLVSFTKGSTLQVQLNTDLRGVVAGRTVVDVSYLASYEGRGNAVVTCVSGCKCETVKIKSHLSEHVSVTKVHEIPVTPSSKCVMRFQTAAGESGSTFKITSLVVRGEAASSRRSLLLAMDDALHGVTTF